MKKNKYIVLIMIVLCSHSFAQTNSNTVNKSVSFIGMTGGYAYAMGNLTKNNYSDNKSGYANNSGFNLGVEGAYYFHKNIGIGGVFSTTSFLPKGLQTMSDGYKNDFDVDSTTVIASGSYKTYNVLIGPYFSFPVNKFTFDIRLLGGLVNAYTPQFEVALEDQTSVTFYQKKAKAMAFGVQVGFGIRYSIIKELCVKFNADFYYSQPNFNITNENRVVNAGRLVEEYNQPFMGIYFNFGIAYQFAK